jgi:hypothetical protein
MYRRREKKALRNSNNSKTRRGRRRRRSKHASESKTFFTNIKNMLRPLFLLFCFLHQENKKTLFPNRKLVRSKEKRTIKLKTGTQPGLQKAQKTKRERERERKVKINSNKHRA